MSVQKLLNHTGEYSEGCDLCTSTGCYTHARIYPKKLFNKWLHLCAVCWEKQLSTNKSPGKEAGVIIWDDPLADNQCGNIECDRGLLRTDTHTATACPDCNPKPKKIRTVAVHLAKPEKFITPRIAAAIVNLNRSWAASVKELGKAWDEAAKQRTPINK